MTGVVITVGVVGFTAGYLLKSPVADIEQTAADHVPVYVAVEERVIQTGLQVQGVVEPSGELIVRGSEVSGTSRLVVTSCPLLAGDAVGNQTLLGALSGRPLIALTMTIPPYRDLRSGDAGPDVEQLQSALGTVVTGKVDWATIKRIRDLYVGFGFDPPGGKWSTYVAASELVALPAGAVPATVAEVLPIGETPSDDSPFMRISVTPPTIVFRASAREIKGLSVGQVLFVRTSDGTELPTSIVKIGPFVQQGDGEAAAGYDIELGADPPDASTLTPGQSVSIFSEEVGEPSLAVPILALHVDAGGTYVLMRDGERRKVVVIEKSGGWAQIDEGAVDVGDSLLLTP